MLEKIEIYLKSKNINPIILTYPPFSILVKLKRQISKLEYKKKMNNEEYKQDDLIENYLDNNVLIDEDGNIQIFTPEIVMCDNTKALVEEKFYQSNSNLIYEKKLKSVTRTNNPLVLEDKNFVVDYVKREYFYDLNEIEWQEKITYYQSKFLTLEEANVKIKQDTFKLTREILIKRNLDLGSVTVTISAPNKISYSFNHKIDLVTLNDLNIRFSLCDLIQFIDKRKTIAEFERDNSGVFFSPTKEEYDDYLDDVAVAIGNTSSHKARIKMEKLFVENRINQNNFSNYSNSPNQVLSRKIGGYSALSLLGMLSWISTVIIAIVGIMIVFSIK